jgi:hypothetical protein
MKRLMMLIMTMCLLAACAAPTATPRPIGPTATDRPFPTFGPTRTRTPTRTPRPTETIVLPTSIAPLDTATPAATAAVTGSQPIGTRRAAASAPSSGQIARSDVPGILRSALLKAGVTDPKVYWFTFDEGDREEALMIQYASPLRWQTGYQEMLRSAKQTLGQYYLQIDPALYTAFIAATDMTGTSDTVVRLRRFAPEKLAKGEIGQEDFLNNYFEPVPVVIACTADGCTGKRATPFPTFDFPFPFPFPTPTP